jgi:GH15 family glucan-1,4-alpha-glucosidase
MLFRKIERLSGNPRVKVVCRPVANYGKVQGRAHLGSNHIFYGDLGEQVRLTSNISKIHITNEQYFAITEDKYLVLSYGKHMEAPLESTFEEFLRKTINYWRTWIERTTIPDIYQEDIIRSALILKLHQYEDTGAIIASGTTSLPEHPGSGRNWDYRYCWIRDSYFTLSAFDYLSHFAEMEKFSHYIQNLITKDMKHIQPMYKIDGSWKIEEAVLDLKGYQGNGNGPVRIGNAAYTQIQNDVYGQMILSLLPLYVDKRLMNVHSRPPLELIEQLLNLIIVHMDDKDAGIWEYREKAARHTEAYLFHWCGGKAAMKIAQYHKNEKLAKLADKVIKLSSKNLELCYSQEKGAYKVAIENDNLNASEYLLITMNYLKDDPVKAQKHLDVLTKALRTDKDLIYRYQEIDDFGETHSAFMICGFWYVEALATMGRVEEAMAAFENLKGMSNSLGIFSEDVDPKDFSQWGNFGQTYSHVGLINSAFRINKKLDKLIFE